MTKVKKKFKSPVHKSNGSIQPAVAKTSLRETTPPFVRISALTAIIGIVSLAVAIFISGMASPFMGDDIPQIVDNIPVHSIANIGHFFTTGTFYNGQLGTQSVGIYFRPMMTVVYSTLYSMFGAHTIAFHLFQLLICVLSTIFLYLFFRYSFKPVLALFLSLVFLVHPIDSQVVFAIPSMQDALFMFFGILALWILLRFSSVKSLVLVALCLLASLLSKETGILFVAMALLYLFWWDRERLSKFTGILALPIILYLLLKVHAVGWIPHSANAPIDHVDLAGRLLMMPSIMLFYVAKFVLPLKLATAYFWVYPTFSVSHFLLPLAIDAMVIGAIWYVGFKIRGRASKPQYLTYLYFATWTALGLLAHLQIIPLDMTVCETWFYFPMIGLLGMIGLALSALRPNWNLNRPIPICVMAVLLLALGARSAIRGTDYSSEYNLATHDLTASRDDFTAENVIATQYLNQGNFTDAISTAKQSVAIMPDAVNENTLGNALLSMGDYPQAYRAYTAGIEAQSYYPLYADKAALTLAYGTPSSNKQFLTKSATIFPQEYSLWMYLAILDDRNNDNHAARIAIQKAETYGMPYPKVYSSIMNNQSFELNISNSGKSVEIP